MATARNVLYAQLVSVLSTNSNESLQERVSQALDKYRIQHRPGAEVSSDATARELFLNEILAKCTMIAKAELPRRLESVFAGYRMQSKERGSKKLKTKESDKNGSQKGKKKSGPLQIPVNSAPVGGGPMRKSNARGECPKCHSKGVVLAHSYSGDDYFSCIYCGFQAYGAVVETDLDLPLAAELLGRRFDERGEIETEDTENETP